MYYIDKLWTSNVIFLGKFYPGSYKVVAAVAHDEIYILYYNKVHTLLKDHEQDQFMFNVPEYIDTENTENLCVFVVSKEISIWRYDLSESEKRHRLLRLIKLIWDRFKRDFGVYGGKVKNTVIPYEDTEDSRDTKNSKDTKNTEEVDST